MLSSFFSKSKPIHLAIICTLLTLVFVLVKMPYFSENSNSFNWYGKQIVLLGLSLFTLFVLDFLASRNKLTKKNSYKLLFFALCVIAIPKSLLNSDILVANVFLLLAIRRLVSLRSQKQIMKKLFDASFWICVASLFYFWAILFIALVFAALLLFKINIPKYWLIPLIAVTTVLILFTCYALIFNMDVISYFENKLFFSFNFSGIGSKRTMFALSLMLAYYVWGLFFYFGKISQISRNLKAPFYLIFITSIIAILLTILVPNKNGGEWLFFFTPFAIIITNYLEEITEKWFKESLILVFLVVPFLALLL